MRTIVVMNSILGTIGTICQNITKAKLNGAKYHFLLHYVKVCLIDYGDQQVVDIRNVFNITKELEEHPTVCRYVYNKEFMFFF